MDLGWGRLTLPHLTLYMYTFLKQIYLTTPHTVYLSIYLSIYHICLSTCLPLSSLLLPSLFSCYLKCQTKHCALPPPSLLFLVLQSFSLSLPTFLYLSRFFISLHLLHYLSSPLCLFIFSTIYLPLFFSPSSPIFPLPYLSLYLLHYFSTPLISTSSPLYLLLSLSLHLLLYFSSPLCLSIFSTISLPLFISPSSPLFLFPSLYLHLLHYFSSPL